MAAHEQPSSTTTGDRSGRAARREAPRGSNGAVLTPKGKRTLERTKQAGRQVLEEHGYPDATVVEIAERSGIALGTFYRYFDNKEALFLWLLEDLLAELNESAALRWDHDEVLSNLRETSRRYLTSYHRNRKLIAALLQMAGANEDCARLWWELRTEVHERMERYLATTPLADAASPKLLASALAGMTEQFAFHWFVEGERHGKPMPAIDEAAETVAVLWYRAVYR